MAHGCLGTFGPPRSRILTLRHRWATWHEGFKAFKKLFSLTGVCVTYGRMHACRNSIAFLTGSLDPQLTGLALHFHFLNVIFCFKLGKRSVLFSSPLSLSQSCLVFQTKNFNLLNVVFLFKRSTTLSGFIFAWEPTFVCYFFLRRKKNQRNTFIPILKW